jgi:hypothetical protein
MGKYNFTDFVNLASEKGFTFLEEVHPRNSEIKCRWKCKTCSKIEIRTYLGMKICQGTGCVNCSARIRAKTWTTEEWKIKMLGFNLNRIPSNSTRKKMSNSQKQKWTPEMRKLLSQKYSGKNNPHYCPDREKIRLNKKLGEICKTMLSNFLQGKCKKGKTREILCYTPNEFKLYIESLWEPWMNWRNYGHHSTSQKRVWNIDHIKPVTQFAKEGIFDPKIVNALSNLRPLESSLNYQKNGKFINV